MAAKNGNGGGTALTIREVVLEIRDDVKSLTALVAQKADKADLNKLAQDAIRKEEAVVLAKQVADDAIRDWQDKQATQRREDTRWVKPMAWSVSATMLLGLANLALRVVH